MLRATDPSGTESPSPNEVPKQDDGSEVPRFAKRQRLTMACTQCRKRKVRCDEGQPKCSHCTARNEKCVTTDPRTPAGTGTRRRTSRLPSPGLVHTNGSNLSHRNQDVASSDGSPGHRDITSMQPPSRASFVPVHIPQLPTPITTREDSVSVVSPYNYGIMINTDESTYRRKMVGGNSLQALARYLDLYFEHKGWEVIGKRFACGIQHAEEGPRITLDMTSNLPSFPQPMDRQRYMDAFSARLYPIFPILDMSFIQKTAEGISLADNYRDTPLDLSLLVICFAIFSLGADEYAGTISEAGTLFLEAAYSLYGFVLAFPYLHSVQALLLLTIALRGRNKDGAAWHTLGTAIRIAYSIGIHRSLDRDNVVQAGRRVYQTNEDLDARVWWACYCLDKMMSMECGRPSAIRDIDCNQILPVHGIDMGSDIFVHWVGLAQIQSRLAELLYYRKPSGQNAAQLLKDIGKLDHDLCRWAAEIEPEAIRPTLDLLCSVDELHAATFLSMQYYETMITVHQAALMLDESTYTAKVKMYCSQGPIQARLLASESILVNSARKIANLQIDAADRHIRSRVFTATPVMLSIVVLSINIMRHTGERRSKTDLELLTLLSHYIADEYAVCGQDPGFYQFCNILREQTRKHVYEETSNDSPQNIPKLPLYKESGSRDEHSIQRTPQGFAHQTLSAGQQTYIQDNGEPLRRDDMFSDLFGNVALEDPWSLLLADDNAAIESLFMMSGSQ